MSASGQATASLNAQPTRTPLRERRVSAEEPGLYTPPGTMQSVDATELQRWALEAAMARGVPLEADKSTSWRRRRHAPPSWLLPVSSENPATRSLSAQKRSYWRRKPYERTLRVRYNEFGPFEFATLNPGTGAKTNSWHLDEVLEVLTEKTSIYLVFPGSWVSAKTFLEVSTDTPEHAAALVAEWGWEPEQTSQSWERTIWYKYRII